MDKMPEAALHCEIMRRLGGLVTAPVRLIPDLPCLPPQAKNIWSGQWTRVEMAAARYYEELGYEVVRLEHFTSQSVGQSYEAWAPGGKQLGDAMRRILPRDVYTVWTSRRSSEASSLDRTYPRDYPVSGYVPDLLLSGRGEWRLAEIKGPGDALHPRQATGW